MNWLKATLLVIFGVLATCVFQYLLDKLPLWIQGMIMLIMLAGVIVVYKKIFDKEED